MYFICGVYQIITATELALVNLDIFLGVLTCGLD